MEGGFLSRRARQGLSEGSVVEVNGEAGDVMLTHPFMVHARSKNLGQRGLDSVRFMCHPAVPLSAPMNVGAVGDAGVDDSLRSPVSTKSELLHQPSKVPWPHRDVRSFFSIYLFVCVLAMS